MNRVILIGYLGQDPELRHTQTGMAVANFSIATTRKWTDASGNQQEQTQWHRIVVWDKIAQSCAKFLAKGKRVAVEGDLRYREWDRDGVKTQVAEVNAQSVEFLSPANEGNGMNGPAPAQPQATASRPAADDDDLPF